MVTSILHRTTGVILSVGALLIAWALLALAAGPEAWANFTAGYAYKVDTFVRNGWISVIGSLVLTALIWIVAMMSRGGA